MLVVKGVVRRLVYFADLPHLFCAPIYQNRLTHHLFLTVNLTVIHDYIFLNILRAAGQVLKKEVSPKRMQCIDDYRPIASNFNLKYPQTSAPSGGII